jgi:hypothetical protein
MNRGRHRKKKENKIYIVETLYNAYLRCYITYYINNDKLEIENVKPR